MEQKRRGRFIRADRREWAHAGNCIITIFLSIRVLTSLSVRIPLPLFLSLSLPLPSIISPSLRHICISLNVFGCVCVCFLFIFGLILISKELKRWSFALSHATALALVLHLLAATHTIYLFQVLFCCDFYFKFFLDHHKASLIDILATSKLKNSLAPCILGMFDRYMFEIWCSDWIIYILKLCFGSEAWLLMSWLEMTKIW